MYIVCHRVVVLMKTGLRGLKKNKKQPVTSQEITVFGSEEENLRCFCFASNHTENGWGTQYSVAGVGFGVRRGAH